MGRFPELRSSQEVGSFDGQSCVALWGVCVDSAVGLDGVPHSLFKVPFPWWQRALLNFFNLVLSWGVVPTLWKQSIVVPVFKRRDAGLATNYRSTSLASCCFKLFEHLVHFSIGPLISSQLDVCQGRFRWSADVLVSSLLDVLLSRRSALTFVAFVDLQKAFDTAWVGGTLVRLHEVGVCHP